MPVYQPTMMCFNDSKGKYTIAEDLLLCCLMSLIFMEDVRHFFLQFILIAAVTSLLTSWLVADVHWSHPFITSCTAVCILPVMHIFVTQQQRKSKKY